jgi:hypothetical protein
VTEVWKPNEWRNIWLQIKTVPVVVQVNNMLKLAAKATKTRAAILVHQKAAPAAAQNQASQSHKNA